jgi:type II secretory pathway pseudopilin PulG
MTMRARRFHAFTLIELLAAASITALIGSLILMVTGHMLAAWSRTSGQLGAEAQARIALDVLSLDLQSALYRDDSRVWLSVEVLDHTGNSGRWVSSSRQKPAGAANASLLLATPSVADARFGQAGVALRFFTSARGLNDATSSDRTASTASAPCAVAYQIIRRRPGANPAGTDEKYLLHRALVRPAQAGTRPGTLETGFDLDPAAGTGGYLSPDSANDGTQPGDPFSLDHPDNPECILAENVIDFGLYLYRRAEGGDLERIFPLDENDRSHLARAPASGTEATERFPAVIDVMVRVLTEEGARRVAQLESGSGPPGKRPVQYRSDAEWWWGLAGANSRVFTRRIVLPAELP